MERLPTVYVLASKRHGTLYIGVMSNLSKRLWEHQHDVVEGFTSKHGVHHLVHVEQFDEMVTAIEREKRLKRWKRDWKIRLIEEHNPKWSDLTSLIY